jgi:hypothetical protein
VLALRRVRPPVDVDADGLVGARGVLLMFSAHPMMVTLSVALGVVD